MAATTIHYQMPQYRLGGAARRVLNDLMLYRMQAVSKNLPHTVTFSSTGYTVSDTITTATVNLQSEFKGVSLSTGSVTFSPTGTAASALTVTVTGATGLSPKRVDVSPMGRVRIRR